MKPGPASDTSRKIGSAFSRSAIFSAMARGGCLAAFAAASAVALKLREVRPVRDRDLAEAGIEAFGGEGAADDF
jgi:hypothetical protein